MTDSTILNILLVSLLKFTTVKVSFSDGIWPMGNQLAVFTNFYKTTTTTH
jgi:hypothetical protein